HVPAQEQGGVEVALERAHDRVARTGQLTGDLVGELELRPHYGFSFSRTTADTRLPSARPCTLGMTRDMTFPISLGESAPDSATASPTIECSSSSESCSGMYSSMISASRRSPAARSSRPASAYACAASWRRLRSRWSTAVSSPSEDS